MGVGRRRSFEAANEQTIKTLCLFKHTRKFHENSIKCIIIQGGTVLKNVYKCGRCTGGGRTYLCDFDAGCFTHIVFIILFPMITSNVIDIECMLKQLDEAEEERRFRFSTHIKMVKDEIKRVKLSKILIQCCCNCSNTNSKSGYYTRFLCLCSFTIFDGCRSSSVFHMNSHHWNEKCWIRCYVIFHLTDF